MRRVQVWFAGHLVIDHISLEPAAREFEQAMRRRFPSMRVTSEEVKELVPQ